LPLIIYYAIDLTHIFQSISERYAPLSKECIEELTSHLEIKQFDKGEVFVREGQNADKVYFIIQGCARAYYLKDGKDITDWFAFEHEFITAVVSFFGDEPSPHYIESLEDTIVGQYSKNTVESLANKYHDFERLIRVTVTDSMLRHQKRVSSILFHTAEERYDEVMKMYPDITKRVPLTHIASHIGMTLETLSRVRAAKGRI